MTYGAANRLATYDGSAVKFDADGNMTKGPLSGGMADFVFDSRNRLVQASVGCVPRAHSKLDMENRLYRSQTLVSLPLT